MTHETPILNSATSAKKGTPRTAASLRSLALGVLVAGATLATPVAAFAQSAQAPLDPYWTTSVEARSEAPDVVAVAIEVQRSQNVSAQQADALINQAVNQAAGDGGGFSVNALAAALSVPAPSQSLIQSVTSQLAQAGQAGANVA